MRQTAQATLIEAHPKKLVEFQAEEPLLTNFKLWEPGILMTDFETAKMKADFEAKHRCQVVANQLETRKTELTLVR